MANKIKWNEADFRWDDNPHLWNLVVEIVESIDKHGGTVYDAVKDLDKKKKKRLIRLVMKRNNIKVYDEAKEVKNIEAHVEDIEMIVTEVRAKLKLEKLNGRKNSKSWCIYDRNGFVVLTCRDW